MKNRSWITTTIGIIAILMGLRSMWITYVPTQTLYFNLFYVWSGQCALIFCGWIGIHAADHRAIRKP